MLLAAGEYLQSPDRPYFKQLEFMLADFAMKAKNKNWAADVWGGESDK